MIVGYYFFIGFSSLGCWCEWIYISSSFVLRVVTSGSIKDETHSIDCEFIYRCMREEDNRFDYYDYVDKTFVLVVVVDARKIHISHSLFALRHFLRHDVILHKMVEFSTATMICERTTQSSYQRIIALRYPQNPSW